jgi:electron transfer flavoprotein alpha subunit
MSTLVVAEHDGTNIRTGTRSAVTVARELAEVGDGIVEMLVLGSVLESVEAEAKLFAPVIVADSPLLRHPTADRYARVIADVCVARATENIVAASTTFAKDILPRTAALLSASMVTDVNGFSYEGGQLCLRRPMYAGAITATVTLIGQPRIITVRATNFPPAPPMASKSGTIRWVVDESELPRQIEYVGLESRATSRPDVTEARVVVSGGRAFRTREEFEQYVGQLADAFGGATGCTRALVDAGIAPNEWQVGQTGKVVAPELYFALGLSGAVQHLAGMKNSRVVVAVNNDPDAPIFSVANYGLVGDVRLLVPQLIERLAKDSY